MTNQANTEIRALDDAELDMIAGGSIFSSISHAVSSAVHTVEHVATNVAGAVWNANDKQPVATQAVGYAFNNVPGFALHLLFGF